MSKVKLDRTFDGLRAALRDSFDIALAVVEGTRRWSDVSEIMIGAPADEIEALRVHAYQLREEVAAARAARALAAFDDTHYIDSAGNT